MNRIDRLMGIVTAIQSKKHMTAEQIAVHFHTSVRTVYRDLRALGEIGIPVGFEPDKGYFIVPGYFLPPVSLTSEEANALILMEPVVRRFADKSIQQHFGTALNKLKIVLSNGQREKFERLQAQTAHYIPQIYEHLLPDTADLSGIQNAIINQTVLRIEYESPQPEISVREVEPIGLTFYSLNWHMIAWCHLRKGYRDFRTSRIRKMTDTRMPFRKADHIPLVEYLQDLEVRLMEQRGKDSQEMNPIPNCPSNEV